MFKVFCQSPIPFKRIAAGEFPLATFQKERRGVIIWSRLKRRSVICEKCLNYHEIFFAETTYEIWGFLSVKLNSRQAAAFHPLHNARISLVDKYTNGPNLFRHSQTNGLCLLIRQMSWAFRIKDTPNGIGPKRCAFYRVVYFRNTAYLDLRVWDFFCRDIIFFHKFLDSKSKSPGSAQWCLVPFELRLILHSFEMKITSIPIDQMSFYNI